MRLLGEFALLFMSSTSRKWALSLLKGYVRCMWRLKVTVMWTPGFYGTLPYHPRMCPYDMKYGIRPLKRERRQLSPKVGEWPSSRHLPEKEEMKVALVFARERSLRSYMRLLNAAGNQRIFRIDHEMEAISFSPPFGSASIHSDDQVVRGSTGYTTLKTFMLWHRQTFLVQAQRGLQSNESKAQNAN